MALPIVYPHAPASLTATARSMLGDGSRDDHRAARPPHHLTDQLERVGGRMAIRQQVEAR